LGKHRSQEGKDKGREEISISDSSPTMLVLSQREKVLLTIFGGGPEEARPV